MNIHISSKTNLKISVLILLLMSLIMATGSSASTPVAPENWPVPKNLPQYQVVKVIDGDTIEVEKLGKIRYIGMNTPEIHHPTKGVEPYGFEAAIANKKLVAGKQVRLDFDVERRDKYGRILAYVYVGSIFVNAYLVQTGYAQIMTIPPNVKYANLFLNLQREAQQNSRGLWGKVSLPKQSGNYIGSIKGHTYHLRACKWAQKIKKENQLWFDSRVEAQKAGYKPCLTCKP